MTPALPPGTRVAYTLKGEGVIDDSYIRDGLVVFDERKRTAFALDIPGLTVEPLAPEPEVAHCCHCTCGAQR